MESKLHGGVKLNIKYGDLYIEDWHRLLSDLDRHRMEIEKSRISADEFDIIYTISFLDPFVRGFVDSSYTMTVIRLDLDDGISTFDHTRELRGWKKL